MWKRVVLLTCIIIFAAGTVSFAFVAFRVNGKDMQEGQTLALYKDDLDAGRIIFSTDAGDDVTGAEISLDNGRRCRKRIYPIFDLFNKRA